MPTTLPPTTHDDPTHHGAADQATAAVVPAPGIGSLLAASAGAAFALICTGVTTGLLLHGQDLPSSLAIGTFAGFWGGAGFGVMVGGVVHADREERAAA